MTSQLKYNRPAALNLHNDVFNYHNPDSTKVMLLQLNNIPGTYINAFVNNYEEIHLRSSHILIN